MSVNGELGIVAYADGEPTALFAFETDEAHILAVYRVVNPVKLRSVPELPSVSPSTVKQNGRRTIVGPTR